MKLKCSSLGLGWTVPKLAIAFYGLDCSDLIVRPSYNVSTFRRLSLFRSRLYKPSRLVNTLRSGSRASSVLLSQFNVNGLLHIDRGAPDVEDISVGEVTVSAIVPAANERGLHIYPY